jgi:prepilin-type processing-associated H-X9-DG protein
LADGWTTSQSSGSQRWVFLTTTHDAANVMFAGDTFANPEGTPNGSTTSILPENLNNGAQPAIWFGHLNYANFLMADGHVESMTRKQVPVFNDLIQVRFPGYTKFWRGLKWKP